MDLPEIRKVYNHFDDGKISYSRLYKVEINEIIPFNDIDEATLGVWKSEVFSCPWLYDKSTDYFIKSTIVEDDTKIIYVRTIHNEWFSLGFWAGKLDLTGNILKEYHNMLQNP